MEKLKEEIRRKKEEAQLLKLRQQQQEGIKSDNNNNNRSSDAYNGDNLPQSESQRKLNFIRQKDRITWQQQQLEYKQQQLDEEREQKRQKLSEDKLIIEENSSQKEAKTTTATSSKSNKHLNNDPMALTELLQRYEKLSNKEIQLKLRTLRQPITLFGENRSDRLQRLIDYLIKHPSDTVDGEDDEYRLQNRRKEAFNIAKEEASFDADDDEQKKPGDDRPRSGRGLLNTENKDRIDESLADSGNEDKEGDSSDERKNSREGKSSLRYDPTIHYHKMKELSPEKIIYKFFRSLVKQWEYDLHQRPEAEKASMKGKLELKAQKQCKDHIRPLFKLCQQKTIPFDIQQKLLLMVTYCEEGNFIKANDEYIKTAIGNSAWPIGLTMVGIHERSGRERISTSKIAHIMNNEQERKYLTAVKRLMTYCQTKRPEVPPSLKVLT